MDHVTSWGAERALFGNMLIYTTDTGTTGANEFSNVIELFAAKIVKCVSFLVLKILFIHQTSILLKPVAEREVGDSSLVNENTGWMGSRNALHRFEKLNKEKYQENKNILGGWGLD